ncbi:hypothetical protein GIB67_035049 [Kingdonia uniflora]|uniref:Cysteine-rich receptor-like protein kinase 10 n=1 Tax=Kingdonia uniflora TaxID=39325 RepID=A0A7J7L1H4_9MAGN|nr:hypothetical protein GIB67_035049 [Kingdonia uniflora]
MNIMKVVLLLIVTSLLLFQTPTRAGDTLEVCSNSANYTSGSQFKTNLDLLLSSLVSNASKSGFYNTSIGNGLDTVYGLAQCRPDQSTEDCETCLNNFIVEIIKRCPNRKAATLREASCVLRYSNQRFFSGADSSPILIYYNPYNASDVPLFSKQRGSLLNNLSQSAALEDSKFKIGSINYTNSQPLYGMVECTKDLRYSACLSCLQQLKTILITAIPDGMLGCRIIAPSCTIRYEVYLFFEISSAQLDNYLPPASVAASPPPLPTNTTKTLTDNGSASDSSSSIAVIVIPIVIGVPLLIAVLCAFLLRRNKRMKRKCGLIDETEMISADSLQFDLRTIRAATNNFSDPNKLGQGGFGVVYKGVLPDGQEIAVKRLSKNSSQGSQEFKNEVVLLHKLQHRNLVRLLGFSLEREEKLLVYEYIPNTSLDKYLFDPAKKTYLDWERRYKIIGGIARGLLYLHEDSRLRIIHRDLKAGNILLDKEMNAKISDFGMAKLFVVDQTQGNTSRIAGTYGYMVPEYALHGLFSVKSDVYSFGVLILEIVSGQKIYRFHESRDLLTYTWKLWIDGIPLELVDPTLTDDYHANEVVRCIHIGLLCVQDNIEDRPTMSSVMLMLSSFSLTLTSPTAPALFTTSTNGPNKPIMDLESKTSTISSSM